MKTETANSNSHEERPEAATTRQAGRAHRETNGANREPKSLGSLISQSLAEDSQAGVERVLSEIKEGLETAKDYVIENPREAAGLAVCAGAVAWALFGTKPGRLVFEAGAAVAVPYATKWVARNMAEALR